MTPLRQRMIEDMQLRNLARATQRNYILHVAAFARYYGQSPETLDLEAVRQYLLYLRNERKMSAEGVNQQGVPVPDDAGDALEQRGLSPRQASPQVARGTQDGFVFSTAEIETFIRRRDRIDDADDVPERELAAAS